MALKALQDDSIAMNSLLDLMGYFSLQTSARNQLTGMISHITRSGLNDDIEVKLQSGKVLSISVTHASSQRLGLALKQAVLMLFKAPSVLISNQTTRITNQNCIAGILLELTALEDKVEVTVDIGANDQLYAVMSRSGFGALALNVGDACLHI